MPHTSPLISLHTHIDIYLQMETTFRYLTCQMNKNNRNWWKSANQQASPLSWTMKEYLQVWVLPFLPNLHQEIIRVDLICCISSAFTAVCLETITSLTKLARAPIELSWTQKQCVIVLHGNPCLKQHEANQNHHPEEKDEHALALAQHMQDVTTAAQEHRQG